MIMSAYVVDQTIIDEIVTSAVNLNLYARCGLGKPYCVMTKEAALTYGRMLWTENVRSVIYRYPQTTKTEAEEYAEMLRSYRFIWRPAVPGQVAKRLAVFEYQSCECDDWEQSLAYDFACRLIRELVKTLPGYDETPWG
jgi:hypothetical protein